MDGVVDTADELILKAADVNMDGFLDDTEVSAANLGDILTKAGLIPDPGMPSTRGDVETIELTLNRLKGGVNVPVTVTDPTGLLRRLSNNTFTPSTRRVGGGVGGGAGLFP